jgi:hypothetical protein
MMLLPEVEEFFAGVRGRECWSVIGGAGSGSIISLRFGEKIRSKQPLHNPELSFEERIFEGERSLIVYCDWRLEAESGLLGSSQSVTEDGELDLSPFHDVKNRIVANIGFTSRLNDLRIEFDNGIVLSVFCDLPLGDAADSNYVMFNPLTCIAITTRGSLAVEKR